MKQTLCRLLGHGDLKMLNTYSTLFERPSRIIEIPVRTDLGKFRCLRCDAILVIRAIASKSSATTMIDAT